ncbi:hypothetical protein SAMN05444000_1093 [Shimia gijangensis]|uniref:Uncharacterized protein n=1 Tax=Shimia gijangensis TaxID=1470563 RepID=A0A1M6JF60_9RHOB|nr:hypothetical protein [Shimia gijangensis]SHJ45265.1 hypothetical protein SAMN05444000_1093 [Shimia gijangensis]
MRLSTKKYNFAWKVLELISSSNQVEKSRIANLGWFGIKLSWKNDVELACGELDVQLWSGSEVDPGAREIVLAPYRSRLEDEDLVAEIADDIERHWDRTAGVRELET